MDTRVSFILHLVSQDTAIIDVINCLMFGFKKKKREREINGFLSWGSSWRVKLDRCWDLGVISKNRDNGE